MDDFYRRTELQAHLKNQIDTENSKNMFFKK